MTQSRICLCCNRERPESELFSPLGRSDAAICEPCLAGLATHASVRVTASFPTRDMAESRRFYETAGFEVARYDDGYFFVVRDGHELIHLVHAPDLDPHTNRAACYLHCDQAAEWHEQWAGAGLPVSLLEDRPWGKREFSVIDPSGNLIRVGQPSRPA